MIGTPPLRASRRRVLAAPAAAVAAGLGAAGCDAQSEPRGDSGGDSAGGSPTSSPSVGETVADPSGTPSSEPDQTLVDEVLVALAGTAAFVTAAGRGQRSLARELAPWRRLHREHLDAISRDYAAEEVLARGGVAARRRQVRAREAQLQEMLADAAVTASSGSLAALLASMSAAVAQQLADDEVRR